MNASSELRMIGDMPASGAQTNCGRMVEIRTEGNFEPEEPEFIPRYPIESMFPEAMNRKLKDENTTLQYENSVLKKSLKEAETKAQMKLNDIPSPLKSLGRSSDLAASKIVELSKKVRELSAKLGAAENKANSAEAQLAVYMASQRINANEETNETNANDNDNGAEKEQQLKELTEKLNAANNKLCESRNQMQSLKQELKIVQKALANEVGDEATAANILSGNANSWRGRAQQILSLQQKVAELSSKLSTTDVLGKEKSALSVAINEKHAEKEKVAALNKELEALREELADFKNKGEAAKARIKVLATDLNSNKAVVQTLQAKNENSEQNIAKLSSQLAGLMEKAQERENNITRQLNNRIDEMSKELRQEKAKCEQLKEIIADRDLKISKLEERLKIATATPNSHLSPEIAYCGSPRQEELRSRCSSVDRERSPSASPQLQTSEGERMRLMELATVLNKRVEHERRELDKALDELRKERQRGAKLEVKLAKMEMEKVGGARASYYRSNSTPNSAKSTINSGEFEALKDKCELLQEKCYALEARLETTRREKDEESKMYMNIIEEARQTFKEHIRPVKSAGRSTISLP